MEQNAILARLLAAARAHRPSEAAPYAFEQRIMARLSQARVEDNWSLWGRALWRAAAACLAASILFSAWSTWSPRREANATTLEDAVFAAVEQPGELW